MCFHQNVGWKGQVPGIPLTLIVESGPWAVLEGVYLVQVLVPPVPQWQILLLPHSPSSEASPSSLVIHSPSPDVFNSMKHTLGCLVMVSAIKLNVDPSVLMGGIHEVLDMIAQN